MPKVENCNQNMFCECTHIALHPYECTYRTFTALWKCNCKCSSIVKEGNAALTQLPPEVSQSNGSVQLTSTELGSSPQSEKVRKALQDFESKSCIQNFESRSCSRTMRACPAPRTLRAGSVSRTVRACPASRHNGKSADCFLLPLCTTGLRGLTLFS